MRWRLITFLGEGERGREGRCNLQKVERRAEAPVPGCAARAPRGSRWGTPGPGTPGPGTPATRAGNGAGREKPKPSRGEARGAGQGGSGVPGSAAG